MEMSIMGHEAPKVLVVDDDMRLRALQERYFGEHSTDPINCVKIDF